MPPGNDGDCGCHNGDDAGSRPDSGGVAGSCPPAELPVVGKGSFYSIREGPGHLIMEDRTKRGLEVRERSGDEKLQGVPADKGMIHDMDGIGHLVPIRWYFPKDAYDLRQVTGHADALEQRYEELRALTCPDDDV